jgi:hypothetical protein
MKSCSRKLIVLLRPHDWVIDHDSSRTHFGPLQNLQRIAFSCDTYESVVNDAEPADYYHDIDPSVEYLEAYGLNSNLLYPEDVGELWERFHWRPVLSEVDKYTALLPRLEWAYFCQLQMVVEGIEADEERRALILSKFRELPSLKLEGMLGWEGIFCG